MEQEVRFCASADGTRIAYATYGNDAARALVYVQAFETSQEGLWTGAMRTLLEGLASDSRLVTLDFRLHELEQETGEVAMNQTHLGRAQLVACRRRQRLPDAAMYRLGLRVTRVDGHVGCQKKATPGRRARQGSPRGALRLRKAASMPATLGWHAGPHSRTPQACTTVR